MKYTPPKLHKLWIKEIISEGLIGGPCSDGDFVVGGSCLSGNNPDLACSTGTSALAGCTTGNSASPSSCGPGYGGA